MFPFWMEMSMSLPQMLTALVVALTCLMNLAAARS